jgi:sugar/nucleoside kinase (ribokinase family)
VDQTVDIIVSGHLCLDLIPEMAGFSSEAIAPGRLLETGPLRISTGGTVSNTGLALLRLGARVGLMATVGDDLLGQAIISFLKDRDEQLAQFIRVQPGLASSYSVVLSPGNTDRTFLHHTGTNATFGIDDVDYALVRPARIFHLGYPPLLPRLIADNGAELSRLFAHVKAEGVVTSMDMTLPDPNGPSGRAGWPAILRRKLTYVAVFLPSIEEALFMMRRADFDVWGSAWPDHLTGDYLRALADDLLGLGAAIVGFKLGEMGVYIRTAGPDRLASLDRISLDLDVWSAVEVWHPAFAVNVAGTTGAGDAAYAGFLAALVNGLGPVDCVRWACAVGACAVEAADSTSGVRSWPETAVRLETDWPVRPERLPGLS